MKKIFLLNYKFYLQEAFGLAIFMISACYFGANLFSSKSSWLISHYSLFIKNCFMGLAMGLTALFIFYSPYTSKSGSQINPAVTITFLRLNKMCKYDAIFYIFFQIIGGVLSVYLMQFLMGDILINSPINSLVTVPQREIFIVCLTEFFISFLTMLMILVTSENKYFKNYTRVFASVFVCLWVIIAGPISGFGMNPARTMASAFPANIWSSFWIYLIMPIAGMLLSAELFLFFKGNKSNITAPTQKETKKYKFSEPFEYFL